MDNLQHNEQTGFKYMISNITHVNGERFQDHFLMQRLLANFLHNIKLVFGCAVTIMGNVQNMKLVFSCAVTFIGNVQNMKLVLCCPVTLMGNIQNMKLVFCYTRRKFTKSDFN